MTKNALSRFEALAQYMFEEKLGRLFGGQIEPLDVAGRLVKAMEESSLDGQVDSTYFVSLNPDDFAILTANNTGLAQELSSLAAEMGDKMGLKMSGGPDIHLQSSPEVRRHQVRIHTGEDRGKSQEHTKTFTRKNSQGGELATTLQNADGFLIIQGRRHVLLEKPLVSLGRHPDNDIVLDSRSVSRRHAQIRWRSGHFVIFDIGERGSTLVNGVPITEHVLRSGDVISLSDALIIFGQGKEDDGAVGQKLNQDRNGDTQILPTKRR